MDEMSDKRYKKGYTKP